MSISVCFLSYAYFDIQPKPDNGWFRTFLLDPVIKKQKMLNLNCLKVLRTHFSSPIQRNKTKSRSIRILEELFYCFLKKCIKMYFGSGSFISKQPHGIRSKLLILICILSATPISYDLHIYFLSYFLGYSRYYIP